MSDPVREARAALLRVEHLTPAEWNAGEGAADIETIRAALAAPPSPAPGLPRGERLPIEAITGTLLHRAWLKSGRPDPLIDSDAWDGFGLTIQALAEVEGLIR